MTPEALQSIRESIRKMGEQLREFKHDLDNARKAGIEVSDMQAQYQERLSQYNRMKSVYGE